MEDEQSFFAEHILTTKCLPQQRSALPLCYLELIHNFGFTYSGTAEIESNNFVVLLGAIGDEKCAVLPIYHEYEVEHEALLEFIDSCKQEKKYIGLVGADGSISLYEVGDVDIGALGAPVQEEADAQ